MTSPNVPPNADVLLAETQWLRALARSLVVDPAAADDVAQEAALVALTKPPSNAAAMRAWLRRVAKNLASNARRGAARRTVREQAVAAGESTEAADEVVARWELRRSVVEAVLGLAEPYRATILLRYFDGLTAAEAAARVGVPLETVRTRTRRGLELLRARLAHLDDRDGRRGVAVLLFLARPDPDVAATGAAFTGGVVMASTTKWAAACALLLLLGVGAMWAVVERRDAPRPQQQETPAAVAVAAPPKARHSVAPVTAPSETIDLDACDRERDLHGVVLDPDGHPVAGATVTARRRQPWGVTLRTHDETRIVHDAEATKSAADGKFVLRLTRGDEVGLRAEADGFAVWESERRQAGERVTIRLVRGLTLDVVVKSKDGAAVADAPVRVGIESEMMDHVRIYALTDADGRARFPRMPRGAKGSVSVSMSVVYQQLTLADAETQTVVVTLPATRAVHGTVVDAATKAVIEGARVSIYGGFPRSVATDSLGRFEIDAFESRQLLAEAPGYARADLKVEEGENVAFALEKVTRLTGRVVDSDGNPLKDADVALIGNSDMGGRFEQSSAGGATTDADGKFLVDGLLRRRSHLLRVRADAHAMLCRQQPTGPDDSYDIGDVVLGAAHTLRGVVVDADGKAVPRVEVSLTGPGGGGDFVHHLDRLTDDLGRFAFADLPPGGYSLEVSPSSWKNVVDAVVPASGEPPLVTIRTGPDPQEAKPKHPVTVRVTDEEGHALAGVRISVLYIANGATPYTATGADGTLTLQAEFWPGSVSATPPQGSSQRWLRAYVTLRPGQREAALVMRRAAALDGRVVDEAGDAVKMAWVEAFDGAQQAAAAMTDEQGHFELAVAPGSKFDVRASLPHAVNDSAAPKRSVAELSGVAAGTTDIVLKMVKNPPAHTVDVEVVDEAGAAITGAQIRAEFVGHDQMKPVWGAVGADGHARLEGLPRSAAMVTVTISDPEKRPNRSWGPMPRRIPGDVDSVKIVVAKPRAVRGRVVFEDGSPCAGAFVYAGGQGSGVADVDGRFAIDVASDLPVPAPVHASPLPFNAKKPFTGNDLVEAEDRELTIVLHAVPAR